MPTLSALSLNAMPAVALDLVAAKTSFEACLKKVEALPLADRNSALEALAKACLCNASHLSPMAVVYAQRFLSAKTGEPLVTHGPGLLQRKGAAQLLIKDLRSRRARTELRAKLELHALTPADEMAMNQLLSDADQLDRELNIIQVVEKDSPRARKLCIACAAAAGALGVLSFVSLLVFPAAAALLVGAVACGVMAWKSDEITVALHRRGYFNTP